MLTRQEGGLPETEPDRAGAGDTQGVCRLMNKVSGAPCETSSTATPKATSNKFGSSFASKPLSVKELEVLHWAREGKTVWEISVIRAVSQATVKFHLRNIYCKLQVNNRVQAVGEAIKRGLCK